MIPSRLELPYGIDDSNDNENEEDVDDDNDDDDEDDDLSPVLLESEEAYYYTCSIPCVTT